MIKAGIDVPTLYHVDLETARLYFEFIDGQTTKAYIDENQKVLRRMWIYSSHIQNQKLLCSLAEKIGENAAKMHNANIIHGDLTTSNMMLRSDTQSLVLTY